MRGSPGIVLVMLASLALIGSDAGVTRELDYLQSQWSEVDSLSTWTLSDSLAREAQLRLPNSPNDDTVEIKTLFNGECAIGWALERNAMGRYEPFRFLMAMDTTGAIRTMKVLEYRSMYGSEIQSDGFLRQFFGLTEPERVRVGRAIDAISGASISSRTIAEEAGYTLMALQWLHSIGALKN